MERAAINLKELREILRFVSETIAREESQLNALDAAIGDGDHGLTVRAGFQAVEKSVEDTRCTDISTILGDAGRAFMDATGGAIGIILGRMLICGEEALNGHEALGADELRCWFDAMESTITAVGQARPGDKTILDAVHAANVAISGSILQRNNLTEALLAASQAASQAASDTANMLCRVGRASRLGKRALGHPDPGAVTFSIILDCFYRWLIEHPLETNAVQLPHSCASNTLNSQRSNGTASPTDNE